MKTLKFTLRDNETGEEREYVDTYKDDYENENIDYLWTDGNYGCDCNRGNFFYDNDKQYDCNTGRFTIISCLWVETGEIVCVNDEWDWL